MLNVFFIFAKYSYSNTIMNQIMNVMSSVLLKLIKMGLSTQNETLM